MWIIRRLLFLGVGVLFFWCLCGVWFVIYIFFFILLCICVCVCGGFDWFMVGFDFGLFSGLQLDFLENCRYRLNMCVGAVRSGKTVITCLAFLLFVLESDYTDFLLTAKTRDTAYRNVVKPLMLMCGTLGVGCKYGKVDGILSVFVDGDEGVVVKEIHIIGLTDEKSVERLQGMTAAAWLGDEVTTYPLSALEMAYSRCSLPGSRIFWTMNPSTPYHPVYTDYVCDEEALRGGRFGLWEFGLDDNLTLVDEIKEDLRVHYKKKGSIFYDRYILGRWVVAEGAVFQNFDEGRHTLDVGGFRFKDFDNIRVGVDYGTASQTVFVLTGVVLDDDGDECFTVLKEWVWDAEDRGVQLTDSQLVGYMGEFLSGVPYSVIHVPHDARNLQNSLEEAGFDCKMINPDVNLGVQKMRDLFGDDRLLLNRDCVTCIGSIQSYVWDPKALLKGVEKPLKVNDHAVDAVRYSIGVESYSQPFVMSAGYW